LAAEGRYSRNELLFGYEGQKQIGEAGLGIVGLGGLGSHIALAYLGVLDYVLVDADEVSESSLNRLIGANGDDVGTKKVTVARRLIGTVQPEARIVPVEALLPAEEALESLSDRSYVFGCLDEDPPRLQLIDFTSQRGITYIDAASDVFPGASTGGRSSRGRASVACSAWARSTSRTSVGGACRPINVKQMTRYTASAEACWRKRPSLVSLNGVVASLAVNEFMVDVTGMSEPVPFTNYRADQRMVGRRAAGPNPQCPYCSCWPTGESV
jgi:molybdopterin-synthase adenylyltransferase